MYPTLLPDHHPSPPFPEPPVHILQAHTLHRHIRRKPHHVPRLLRSAAGHVLRRQPAPARNPHSPAPLAPALLQHLRQLHSARGRAGTVRYKLVTPIPPLPPPLHPLNKHHGITHPLFRLIN